jgi:tRNA (mo5U34)-methyltransferase
MSELTHDDIRKRVAELGGWFHNLDLRGVKTAPRHSLGDYPNIKWRQFAHTIENDLSDKTVLDIGCNAGFYSIEMKRRGAKRVVGIDSDRVYLEQARFAADICEMDIEFRELSVYDLGRLEERFDIVFFMGVLYHLRYPLLALDIVRRHVLKDRMVFQSMLRGSEEVQVLAEDYPFTESEMFERTGFPQLYFIERQFAGDPTNWWIPNRACVEAMLRSAGFEIIDRPEREVYICRAV